MGARFSIVKKHFAKDKNELNKGYMLLVKYFD